MKYDLYQYDVAESVMTPAITIQGRVTNRKNGDPLEASITVEVFGNTNQRLGTVSDKRTGKFSITLPGGSDYSFTVEKSGFLFDSRRMDKKDLKTASISNIHFGLVPLSKGEVLVIPTIYFDPDSAQLRSDSLPALERVYHVLMENPALRFRITGHVADTPDRRQDPVELSQRRAMAVKDYLVKRGCAESRLETVGMGSAKPVADNATPEGREQNRRTEFEIISD
jgi:outer membrane protein OmpA-like peptidoglycan-associated protein